MHLVFYNSHRALEDVEMEAIGGLIYIHSVVRAELAWCKQIPLRYLKCVPVRICIIPNTGASKTMKLRI